MPPRAARPKLAPGGVAVTAGLLLLAATFYFPVAAARRTARVEERGDRIAELLLLTAQQCVPGPLEPWFLQQIVLARLLRAAVCAGVYVEDLQLLADGDPPDTLTLRNKHYLFQLRPSPLPEDAAIAVRAEGSILPLEVVAWPADAAGPAHAVFFYATNAEPAFTRNLLSGYVGLDPARWPPPGVAHRRPGPRAHPWSYRGFDDERWIVRDRPGSLHRGRSR